MCDMNHDDYFEHVTGLIDDMARIRITIDRITEATNFMPDYIIVPTDWGLLGTTASGVSGENLFGVPILRADVPDLVAGYLGAPKPSPGPYSGIQTESAAGEHPVVDTCVLCKKELLWTSGTWIENEAPHRARCAANDNMSHQPERWSKRGPHTTQSVEAKDVGTVDPKEVEPGTVVRIGANGADANEASSALRTWCEVNGFESIAGSFKGTWISAAKYAVTCDARKK